jgi:hypothetical protein
VGARAGLDAMQKRKVSCHESSPGRPAHGLVAVPTEPSRLPEVLHCLQWTHTIVSLLCYFFSLHSFEGDPNFARLNMIIFD